MNVGLATENLMRYLYKSKYVNLLFLKNPMQKKNTGWGSILLLLYYIIHTVY